MKIEMDDNSRSVATILALVIPALLVVIIISLLTYKYNITAYKLGYSQVQLIGSQGTMWVNTNNYDNRH